MVTAVTGGVSVLVLVGRGKKAVVHKYCLIELPELLVHQALSEPMRPEKVAEILLVSISSAFGGRRIAVREKDHEISYFVYHQWAGSPAEIITAPVEKFIQRAAVFGEVSGEAWRSLTDYRIKG